MIKISRKYIQKLIKENVSNMTSATRSFLPDYGSSDPIQNFIDIRDASIKDGTYPGASTVTSGEENFGSWKGKKIKKENIVDNKVLIKINDKFNKNWIYAKSINGEKYFTIKKKNFKPAGGNKWIPMDPYPGSIKKVKERGELIVNSADGVAASNDASFSAGSKEEEIKKYRLQGVYASSSKQSTFEKLLSKLWDEGYRNTYFFLGLAGVIAKESGFIYNHREKRYSSYERMQEIFFTSKDQRGNISRKQWNALKAHSVEAPFNYFYGGELPSSLMAGWPKKALKAAMAKASVLGNTKSGDGDKFRGGGLIQNTGRSNWKSFGLDINKINDENAVIDAVIRHLNKFLKRMSYSVDSINEINNLEKGINVVADAVAGGKKTSRGRLLATERLKMPCIKYDGKKPFSVVVSRQPAIQATSAPDSQEEAPISSPSQNIEDSIFVTQGVKFQPVPYVKSAKIAMDLKQSAVSQLGNKIKFDHTIKGKKWLKRNIYKGLPSKFGMGPKWTEDWCARMIPGQDTNKSCHWSSFFVNVACYDDPAYKALKPYVGYINPQAYENYQKIISNPSSMEGKITWVAFPIGECPVDVGDQIFSTFSDSFDGIATHKRNQGRHARIFIDNSGTVLGGNESGRVGTGTVELDDQRRVKPGQKYGSKPYVAVFKRVKIIGPANFG